MRHFIAFCLICRNLVDQIKAAERRHVDRQHGPGNIEPQPGPAPVDPVNIHSAPVNMIHQAGPARAVQLTLETSQRNSYSRPKSRTTTIQTRSLHVGLTDVSDPRHLLSEKTTPCTTAFWRKSSQRLSGSLGFRAHRARQAVKVI